MGLLGNLADLSWEVLAPDVAGGFFEDWDWDGLQVARSLV